jgi:hypothetical protein
LGQLPTETNETLKVFNYQGSGDLADPWGFCPRFRLAKNYMYQSYNNSLFLSRDFRAIGDSFFYAPSI